MEKKSTENIDKKLLFDVHRTDKLSKNSKEESYKLSNYKNQLKLMKKVLKVVHSDDIVNNKAISDQHIATVSDGKDNMNVTFAILSLSKHKL